MKKILVISNSAASYHSPILKKIAKNNYLHVIYYSNDLYNDQYNKEYDTVIKKERKLLQIVLTALLFQRNIGNI